MAAYPKKKKVGRTKQVWNKARTKGQLIRKCSAIRKK